MPIQSVKDLVVWSRAMDLTQMVYELVVHLPANERFGLSNQVRRAAVSIPSNIAEGWGYGKTGKYVHHLRIARGSECELRTQLELAHRLGLVDASSVVPILETAAEVGRMLSALIQSLERRIPDS